MLTKSDASEFYSPFEKTVTNWDELREEVATLCDDPKRLFVWRGVTDSKFPLHSKLYRALWEKGNFSEPPDEGALVTAETEVLKEFKRWGLHAGPRGRLTLLDQLALLQHYGAPTRMIDVTFNPYVAIWFSVFGLNRESKSAGEDGRILCIDVTGRFINDDTDLLSRFENHQGSLSQLAEWKKASKDWKNPTVWVWRPPILDPRLFAQHAGFLIGPVPPSFQHPKGCDTKKDGTWNIRDIRTAESVALRIHKLGSGAGKRPDHPTYTIKIHHDAKPEIEKVLTAEFNIEARTMFPDLQGFADYGVEGAFGSYLRKSPANIALPLKQAA